MSNTRSTAPWRLLALASAATLAACAARAPLPPSTHHLGTPAAVPQARAPGEPPPLAATLPLPPKPAATPAPKAERYSVVVNKTPVQDILFVIARDAKLNIDIHPAVAGSVTMSALDQTLTEILDRISRQVDMRYELEGSNLSVMPDSPFLRTYRIEYPNVARAANAELGTTSSVGGGGSGGGGGGNASTSNLTNKSGNSFWATLVNNIRDLLRETDKILPGGSQEGGGQAGAAAAAGPGGAGPGGAGTGGAPAPASDSGAAARPGGAAAAAPSATGAANGTANAANARTAQPSVTFREAASVIANPEAGVISVRATQRQHQRVREFIDRAMLSVRRQVMIEGTILEVELSDEYQQGINWSLLKQNGQFSLQTGPQGGALPSGVPIGGVFPAMATVTGSKVGIFGSSFDLTSVLRMLESFGRTKVLSSPRLSVLNNQPAMLRVVDNIVYFTVSGNYTPPANGSPATVTVSSTANTVSVGFTLGVTPQIGGDDEVTLLLRPTISRVTGYVDDPGIAVFMALARAGGTNLPEVVSRVPNVQTREMESVIKVRGGMTAVLGGLMRDSQSADTDGIPGANALGPAADLLKYKSGRQSKSELVIFLRPVIVTDASLQGDYAPLRQTLDEALRPPVSTAPAAPPPAPTGAATSTTADTGSAS